MKHYMQGCNGEVNDKCHVPYLISANILRFQYWEQAIIHQDIRDGGSNKQGPYTADLRAKFPFTSNFMLFFTKVMFMVFVITFYKDFWF